MHALPNSHVRLEMDSEIVDINKTLDQQPRQLKRAGMMAGRGETLVFRKGKKEGRE